MLKKILIYFAVAVVFGAIGCYFFFADKLYREGMPAQLCKEVTVTLLDSASNRFVTKDEVIEIIDSFNGKSIGKPVDEINTHLMEKLLNQKNAIKESQVSITRSGSLNISITQRKPVLRIQSSTSGFYVDETQYIFPLVPTFTSYVPIVSGHIPFTLNDGHRGKAQEDDTNWLGKMMELPRKASGMDIRSPRRDLRLFHGKPRANEGCGGCIIGNVFLPRFAFRYRIRGGLCRFAFRRL